MKYAGSRLLHYGKFRVDGSGGLVAASLSLGVGMLIGVVWYRRELLSFDVAGGSETGG